MLRQLTTNRVVTVAAAAAFLMTATGAAAQSRTDGSSVADPPGVIIDYYAFVTGDTPQSMRQSLHDAIDDHIWYPYTSTSTDVWDILEAADEDPLDPTRVLDIYKNESYLKYGTGNPLYQREHAWPKSYGFPNNTASNFPYTDCHHLFVANGGYNASRSNKPYRYCTTGCSEKPTEFYDGMGGGSGVYPGNSNWTSGAHETGTWETWIGRRGDVARALLYMDVRYEGGTHQSGRMEPDLILTDNPSLIHAVSENETVAYMGDLSVLIEWHRQDPPTAAEVMRNDVVQSYQGNRNPFVDHPHWVECIFSGVCSKPFINEFHYDNDGTDVGEFVEIAGVAMTSLDGWKLYAYNGSNGEPYKQVSLTGVIPDQDGCMGAISFPISGLQNGPDAFALVEPGGDVRQFISYEGAFMALTGPAAGMMSVDIGVEESSATPVGHSLQLIGTGNDDVDFAWSGPTFESPGATNVDQIMAGPCAELPEPPDPWINEFHYDNEGTDTGEFVEIAGPAGVDLTGWTVLGYNGGDGSVYKTINLAGTIADLEDGFGVLTFAASGLQNSTEGLALVNADDAVVLFISYEGTVTATDGPAEGMTSVDILVSESASTPVGHALQLGGTGTAYIDFAWQTPLPSTSGAVNTGQSFGDGSFADPWINEFHYDNDGGDTNEFVEIAGPAGLNLGGWQVLGYNGSNGEVYMTINLTGVLSDQQAGLGTLTFGATGLQNGAPDGLALVDPQGEVVLFISYEGSFTATEGPASGMTSVDIVVSESPSTPIGHSLQLGGAGNEYADFTWQAPIANTAGTVNAGQSFEN
jgi:endonuclease I